MKYRLLFIPEIQEDIISGYFWYESKSPGLGQYFLHTFYSRIDDLQQNPLIFPEVYKNIRRCLFWKFPYAIYYIITSNQITILGFFHSSRDPHELQRNFPPGK